MVKIYGAVLEFLRDRFKGDLTVLEGEYVTGAAMIEVLSGDADRVALTLVNLGATIIYVSPSLDVSATHGMRLGPNGGTVSMNVEEDSLLPSVGWYAVSPGGAGALYALWCRRTRVAAE